MAIHEEALLYAGAVTIRDFEKADAEMCSTIIMYALGRSDEHKNLGRTKKMIQEQRYSASELIRKGTRHRDENPHTILVAVKPRNGNEEILGLISLDESELKTLFIAAEIRDNGVGSLLVRAIEARAKDLGLDSIFLLSPETAIGYFEMLGYEVGETETVFVDGHPDVPFTFIRCEKDLAQALDSEELQRYLSDNISIEEPYNIKTAFARLKFAMRKL